MTAQVQFYLWAESLVPLEHELSQSARNMGSSKLNKKIATLVMILTVLTAPFALFDKRAEANTKTIYVDASNVGDPDENGTPVHPFDKIQEGIDAANPWDTILVLPGVYNERIDINKDGISLVGTDREDTVIDPTWLSNHAIWVTERINVTITGLTAIEGIKAHRTEYLNVTNCIIANNTDGWGALFVNCSTYAFIRDNVVTENYWRGIYLKYSNNSIISENEVNNNKRGIAVIYSHQNHIVRNRISNLTGEGIEIQKSHTNVFDENTITNYKISGVFLDFSDENEITNNCLETMHACIHAIIIQRGTRNFIFNNTMNDLAQYGISIVHASENNVHRNIIRRAREGIYVSGPSSVRACSNNTIAGNLVVQSKEGISIWGDNNTILENIIVNNEYGIRFYGDNNTISGNLIVCNQYGIRPSQYYSTAIETRYIPENNTCYHNSLVNNANQAGMLLMPTRNYWDNGYSGGGGNYWNDYDCTDIYNGPYQNLTGADGIGDTPYIIGDKDQDNYPLMNPTTTIDYPIPTLFSVDYPDSIIKGEWATITITARNDGGTAEWQSIHCSFPDNPLLERIEILSHDLNGGAEIYPPGTELPAEYGEFTMTSEYAIVEGIHEHWDHSEEHSMTIRVKPEDTEVFTFYVKTVSRVEGLALYDPNETKDQQDEHVYVFKINVIPTEPSIEVLETESEPWNPLEIPFKDVSEATEYIEDFESSPLPEDFGDIPIKVTIANNGGSSATGVSIDARMTGDIIMVALDSDDVSNDQVVPYSFDYTETVFSGGVIDVGNEITEELMLPMKFCSLIIGTISLQDPDTSEMVPLDIVIPMISVHVTLTIKGNFDDVEYEIPEDIFAIGDPTNLLEKWNTQLSQRVQEKKIRVFLETYYSSVFDFKLPVLDIDPNIPTGIYETPVNISPGTTKIVLTLIIPAGITLVGFALLPWGATTPIGAVLIATGLAMIVVNNPFPGEGTATVETASPDLNMTLEVVQLIPENVQTIDHVVVEDEQTFHVTTVCNSTVTDFFFSREEKQINFNINSTSENLSFCHIAIPRMLLRDNATQPWEVRLNSSHTPFTLTENETHSFICFDVLDTGVCDIEIIGAEVIPEFPIAVIVPLLIALTVGVAVLSRKKRLYVKNH